MEMTLGKIKDLLEKGNETSRSQKRWFVTWRGGIFLFGAHRCSHPLEIWCWGQGATELLLATLQQLLQKSHLDFTDLEGEQSLALFPLLCALCVKNDIFIGSILRKTLSKKNITFVTDVRTLRGEGYFSTSFLARSAEGIYQGCIMRNMRTKDASFKVPFSSMRKNRESPVIKKIPQHVQFVLVFFILLPPFTSRWIIHIKEIILK